MIRHFGCVHDRSVSEIVMACWLLSLSMRSDLHRNGLQCGVILCMVVWLIVVVGMSAVELEGAPFGACEER